MSEYVRWELKSLEQPKTEDSAPYSETMERRFNETQRNAYAEGLEKGYEKGFASGHAEGLAKGCREGLAKGYDEGYVQGMGIGRKEGEEASARLLKIANNFREQLLQADELISQDVLDLALDIAKAMLKTAFPVRQDLMLGLVRQIIRDSYGEPSPARLHLNPSDAEWIKKEFFESLADLNWKIVANAQIEQGGCLVETSTTQIDASLPTRWQRIALVLGKEAEWLEI
ncbi:MAG: flagellar assembly protein FliH [Proteobacteria bacterium]|nr:flagellar assembly protein FliH [Pseudomonadota bacterium]